MKIPVAVRRAWVEHAPTALQMWAHRKADYEWRPSRLIANALPPSIVYWTVIRAGVQNIHSHEVVPNVPFMDVLNRVPATRAQRIRR